MRYFKEEPLQHWYNNNFTKEEKLQIVIDLQNDYENGLLSQETIAWIVNNNVTLSVVGDTTPFL